MGGAGVGGSSMPAEGGGGGGADLQQKAHTPVKVDRIKGWLSAYGDKATAKILERGFSEGFRLGYEGPRVRRGADNLKSAGTHREIVQGKLKGGRRDPRR